MERPETPATTPTFAPVFPLELLAGMRFFLFLDMFVRLLIWSVALIASTAVCTYWIGAPGALTWRTAPLWVGYAALWVVLFNVAYILTLLLLRWPVPKPAEGRHVVHPHRVPRAVLLACCLATFTKARFEPPFPAFLVYHLVSLPPLCWLFNRIFGPQTGSVQVTDPLILDPHLVTIGRNVIIGWGALITGHVGERGAITYARVVIEDDVLIGGQSSIGAGVRIGRGAVIGARAMLLPFTVVGPNEFWAGTPARCKRVLATAEEASAAAVSAENAPDPR
jgi:carbonic anhydrase/acetyltransferase-like protein (isoleucine patch superfamily)